MMKGLRKQQGVTGITMVIIIVIAGFAALIALRLVPVYIEHFKVKSHLAQLSKEDGVKDMSNQEILSTLRKRFDIDDVSHVTDDNIFIERPNSKTTVIAIEYEVRTPLFGNVAMVVDFADEVQAR